MKININELNEFLQCNDYGMGNIDIDILQNINDKMVIAIYDNEQISIVPVYNGKIGKMIYNQYFECMK